MFLWVAQLGSFRGAADRLHTTQPAVSQRIAGLEGEFGVRLFDRDARSVNLTAKGRELLDGEGERRENAEGGGLRRGRHPGLDRAFENSMRTTAMIMLIIIAAYFLNFVITSIGLTQVLTDTVTGLGLSKWTMLLVIVVFYLILVCFMETLSMMITTIPIIAPVMVALGFDPLWVGIVIVILIEAALITPPIGLNLYVVQSLRASGGLNA